MTPPRLWPFALVFALSYTQPALYYSNQNQYFLHGAALAGRGDLARDWLAGTPDPAPLFTALVALCEGYLGPAPVYLAMGLACALYFAALVKLAGAFGPAPRTPGGWWLLAALVTLSHCGILRWLSVLAVGVDYPWYLQSGVANQYLLGAGLQPSVAGVLLLVALATYANRQPRLTALALVLAVTLHSTYLLSAALLTGAMIARDLLDSPRRDVARFAVLVGVGVLPTVAYVAYLFDPFGDPELSRTAQHILVSERLPHHGEPARFFDGAAKVQALAILVTLLATIRTRLGQVLAIASAGMLALTAVQLATGSPSLALLFPWRLSAVLVPVATLVGAAGLVRLAEPRPGFAKGAATVVLVAALVGAAWVQLAGAAYQENPAEAGVTEFVRAHRQPGDVVLLPTKVPETPARLRIVSASFVPVRPVSRPFFELQSFRLATGCAVYVDFKSIPYAPRDVIEWRRRVAECERWYPMLARGDAGATGEMRAAGVTLVVAPAGVGVPGATPVYADEWYGAWRFGS